MANIIRSMEKIESAFVKQNEQASVGVNAGRQTIHLAEVILRFVRIGIISSDAVADGVTPIFRLAGTAGRSLMAVGAAFNIALFPVDLAFFGIGIRDLINDKKATQSEETRQWLTEELPDDQLIESVMKKLKDAMIEHSRILKEYSKKDTEDKREESEKKLNKEFNDAKDLIDCKLPTKIKEAQKA